MIHIIMWALAHFLVSTETKMDKKGREFWSFKFEWTPTGSTWLKSLVVYPTKTGYRMLVNYGGHNSKTGLLYSGSTRLHVKPIGHYWGIFNKGKFVEMIYPRVNNSNQLDIITEMIGGLKLKPYGEGCTCEWCKDRYELVRATTVFATHGFSCGCEECSNLPF